MSVIYWMFNMNIAVTGGAGFIGSHIVEYLVSRGDTVTVIDNLFTGKKENLDNVINKINFSQIDIQDFDSLKKILKNVDGVFHEAALASVQESFSKPDEYHNVNVKGTWRTIKASLPQMRKQGEGLIINTSSGLARFSAPFMTVYNSTKFAVEGLTEGLHYEVRPLGVDVVMIQPGAFPTEIFSKVVYGSDQDVVAGYGDLAKVPEQVSEGMGQMFETMKPNPQMVPDAIFKLIPFNARTS